MATQNLNQLDDATLANQYNQIRQAGGSQSARSLREKFREGGWGDTPVTQATGVRRAGGTWGDDVYKDTPLTSDTETQNLLGGRLGEYTTEGGQKQYGYYGDVNIHSTKELNPWLDKSGYAYAKGPEDVDYVKAGLDLPSLWQNPIFKKDHYDFTQKNDYGAYKGVDSYMGSLGYGQNLGSNFDLLATTQLPGLSDVFTKVKDYYGKSTIEDYLRNNLGYQDATNSEFKSYIPNVAGNVLAKTGNKEYTNLNLGQFGYGNQYDPDQYLREMFDTWNGGGIQETMVSPTHEALSNWYSSLYNENGPVDFGPFGRPEAPGQTPGFQWGSQTFNDRAQAEAAKNSELQRLIDAPDAVRNEYMAQKMSGYGGVNPLFQELVGDLNKTSAFGLRDSKLTQLMKEHFDPGRGAIGGNEQADQVTGEQLQKLLNSKDVQYSGNTLGKIFNNPENYSDAWDEKNTWSSKNLTRKKTTTRYDQGIVGAGLEYDDPNWYAQNALSSGNGGYFVGNDKLASMPGAKATDYYDRNADEVVTKKFTTLGKIGNTALNFIPVVGPLASSMQKNYMNDGQLSLGTMASTIGGMVGSAPGGWSGVGSDFGQATGLSDLMANSEMYNSLKGAYNNLSPAWQSAIGGATTGGFSAAAGGGDLTDILKGAGIGGAGGYAGQYAGDVGKDLGGNIGRSIGKGVGSAVGRGLAGAATGNKDAIKDMGIAALIGGTTGGLGTAAGEGLNAIFNPEKDKVNTQNYNRIASTVASLAPKLYQQKITDDKNKKKAAAVTERNQQLQAEYNKKIQQLQARK